jgi:hypothetical protein
MLRSLLAVALLILPSTALAAEGDWVQADNVGTSLVSHDFTSGKTVSIADQTSLSEFVGLHYFLSDTVRVGVMFQFSEVLQPEPTYSRFSKFAILPQVGWNFWSQGITSLFMAGVFTMAPRTAGTNAPSVGIQYLFGAGFEVAKGVKLTAAVEVPWDFSPDQVLGVTPLLGASFKL